MNGVESSGIKAKSFFLQTDSGGGGGGGEGKFQCMSMGWNNWHRRKERGGVWNKREENKKR